MGYNYDDVPAQSGGTAAAEGAQPPEKTREVAPAVLGVMVALKESEAYFRARGPEDQAARCSRAIADLEGMLAASFQRVADATDKPKPPPSPSALFRMGFDYGVGAMAYTLAADEAKPRPTLEDFGGATPPCDWESAWAMARAKIASER